MTMLIDSHVHIMPPWRLKALARWILKAYPDHPVTEEISAEDILDDLKRSHISHFFNFVYPLSSQETDGLNRFNAEFCQATPGAIPFASLHPDTPDKAGYAEKLMRTHPFLGFKFHPFVQRFDPWDSRMDPLYGFLQETGTPVFFHTGFEVFYNMKMPVKHLIALVKRYPRLPMVFVHMAFPDFSTCFSVMDDYPDLYLDATNVLAFFRPEFEPMIKSMPDGNHLLERLLEGMEDHSHKIMYGSDHPVGMGSLAAIYQDLDSIPLSQNARENMRSTTAEGFVRRFLPDYDWSNRLI